MKNQSTDQIINETIAFLFAFFYFLSHIIGFSASQVYIINEKYSFHFEQKLYNNWEKNRSSLNKVSVHTIPIPIPFHSTLCFEESYSDEMNPIRSHAICLLQLKIVIFLIQSQRVREIVAFIKWRK